MNYCLYSDGPNFIKSLIDELVLTAGISTTHLATFMLDHVCYRVGTQEEYDECFRQLSKEMQAQLLIESEIGGRMIATFKLKEPIVFMDTICGGIERKVDVVELPAPKPGRFYPSGLEHVEFAFNNNNNNTGSIFTLASFMAMYPTLEWKTDGMKKSSNADVRLDLSIPSYSTSSSDSRIKCSVKFHLKDLETVIKEENSF